MAKKNKVFIDIVIDDKGTTKRVAVNAKKLGLALEDTADGAKKTKKHTDDLSKSSKDLDRNFRGTAKMSSNMTKNFSKQQQGMGGLVGAYATLAAQVFAVTAAFQFLGESAQFRNLIAGQEAMAATTGTAFKTITNSIITATDAQIKYGDAARAAAIGTAAGLTSGQLTELSAAAKNVSFALGRDLTDSFNRLVRGVTKAEPELLDELGIILRLETANRKYALEIGKTVEELSAFERTQAVSNEVLEQAERKFAAIDALMPKNAASLAKFTKSFDELVNIFRIALIENITPILEFLTRNTEALVAAFALFAIPITRAILPSLDGWKQKTIELRKASTDFKEQYKKDIAEEVKAAQSKLQSQEQQAKQSQRRAKQVLQGDRSSAGLDFMRGMGADDDKNIKRQAAASQKILDNARDQLRDHREVQSGYLKGKNAEEVADLRKSHNQRVAIVQNSTTKQTGIIGRGLARTKLGLMSLPAVAATAYGGMVAVAQGAAVLMNAAFGVVAGIGILTMIIAAVKEYQESDKHLSKAQIRQKKRVQELTNDYKELAGEMANAGMARATLLSGSSVAQNVGATFQSANIPKLIEDINLLSKLDPNTPGFEKLRGDLASTVIQLSHINPAFSVLAQNFRDLDEIDPEIADDLRRIAREAIETGQKIKNITPSIRQVQKDLQGLNRSFLKDNPLVSMTNNIEKAIDNITVGIETSFSAADDFGKRAAEQEKDIKDQRAALNDIKELYKQIQASQDSSGAKAKELERLDKKRALIEEEYEGSLEENVRKREVHLKREKESRELGAQGIADQTRLNALLDKANILKNIQLKATTLQLKEETAAINQQSTGRTIEGKLLNIKLSRVNQAGKLLKAEQAVEQALFAQANDQETSTEQRQKNVDLAKAQLDKVRAENGLQERKNALTEIELRLQRELRDIAIQKRDADQAALGFRNVVAMEEAMGGGTRRSRIAVRENEINALGQELLSAQTEQRAAANAYVVAREANIREAIRDERSRQGLGYFDRLSEDSRARAVQVGLDTTAAGSEQEALNQARQDVNTINIQKKAQEDIVGTQLRSMQAAQEKIKAQMDGNVLLREEKILQENIAQLVQSGATDAEINAALPQLKAQAVVQADLETSLSNQIQLGDTLKTSMENAFAAMIQGTMSAKEAFAQMAKAVLADIAKMIAKQLVLNMLRSAGFGFADGGVTPEPVISARYGGMTPKRDYSTGGIARGPQSGYSATLHGNEAIVPLPNSRSIPVEFPQGGPGGNNNVTVNVTMNSDGTASSETQGDTQMGSLGNAIAKAVQVELQNQRRAGGILSPYGAA